ncbi:MAG TPA: adenosylcobinamide-phosphate synthase CbiB [Magnetospirillum sp.]|jgi:adenosylcobinamide-phosphate synthase|nr:adenosylcobinamide-phosphate synthase CbiB [Magnetospirillum sp.]
MLPFGTHFGHSPDALLMLFMALAVDAVFGEMGPLFRVLPHPVVLIGRLIGRLDKRLNKPSLPEADRRVRGVVLVALMAALALGLGFAIAFVARAVPHLWLLEVLVAATLVAQRSLFNHVDDVARALEHNGLEAGRYAVSRIVGRDPQSLDEHGVARAAIESLAENFSDAVVAPVFWYVLLGLPGLLLYKTVNTLDSMVGYRNDKYRAFGWASARLDDAMNIVPARLAGLIIALAAIVAAKGRPLRAIRTMISDARHHKSPNSGWPEAAMAGALDLALGGPRKYPGLVVDEKWIGQGRARATIADIDRSLHLFSAACLIDAGLVVLVLWAQASF